MKRLMDLGAPRLPAGHFYRVRSNSFGQAYVEIRQERRFGSRLLAERRVPRTARRDAGPDVPVSVEDGLAYAARKAYEAVREDLDADYWKALRAWEGDHRHDWRTEK
jgi:hypothetical protein